MSRAIKARLRGDCGKFYGSSGLCGGSHATVGRPRQRRGSRTPPDLMIASERIGPMIPINLAYGYRYGFAGAGSSGITIRDSERKRWYAPKTVSFNIVSKGP